MFGNSMIALSTIAALWALIRYKFRRPKGHERQGAVVKPLTSGGESEVNERGVAC
jgi:hypothetical protein